MNCNIQILSTNIKLKNITNYIQILSIIISIIGVSYQIYCIKNNYLLSSVLSICLTFVLLLKLPNQICVAFEESNGWTTVYGTIISTLLFSYLSYITFFYNV
jgi:hypothetical protein